MSVENGLSPDPGSIEAKMFDADGRSGVEREFGGLGLALIIAVALTNPDEDGDESTIITSRHVLSSLRADDTTIEELEAMLAANGFEEITIDTIKGDGRKQTMWDHYDPDDEKLWRRRDNKRETWQTPNGGPSFQAEQAQGLWTEHELECPTILGYDFGFGLSEFVLDDDPSLEPYTEEAAEQLNVEADPTRTYRWNADYPVGPPKDGSDRVEPIEVPEFSHVIH